MPNLTVSLPAVLRNWVSQQIHEGRFGNASEYIRHLIRRDQDRRFHVACPGDDELEPEVSDDELAKLRETLAPHRRRDRSP